MAISEKDIEIIERYLLGECEEKEVDAINQRIEIDKEFADEIRFMKAVINGSKEEGRNDYKERLKTVEKDVVDEIEYAVDEDIREQVSGEGNKSHLMLNKRIYYVLAVAALIVAGVFIFIPDNTDRQLYEAYFQPYPNEVVPYTRGQQVPEEFEHLDALEYNSIVQAMKYYDQGNYKEALKLFTGNVAQSENNAGILFYKSICQLETNKEIQAIGNFSYILSLTTPPLEKQAEWYLALAYLKTNQTGKATQLLEKIHNEKSHPYAEKAEELLIKLKMFKN